MTDFDDGVLGGDSGNGGEEPKLPKVISRGQPRYETDVDRLADAIRYAWATAFGIGMAKELSEELANHMIKRLHDNR